MEEINLGDQIREARKSQNLNQSELAFRCKLDIRTVQRIESGEVIPRLYTLRLLNKVLETSFIVKARTTDYSDDMAQYYKKFEQRRIVRIALSVFAVVFLISVGLLSLNNWVLFGMPKRVWAPFVYIVMFGVIGAIAFVWRCPGCNAMLGDVTNTRYCSKCGLHLRKD